MLLDKYILKAFKTPLIYGFIFFIGVLIIPELFKRFSQFMQADVSLWIVIKYFGYKLPLIISLISPVVVLLACFFSLGGLSRYNEITALKSSGINLYRISLPILLFSLFISIIVFLWNETVVPIANKEMERIIQIEIQKKPPDEMKVNNVSFKSSQGWFVNIKFFDYAKGSLEGIEIKSCYPDGGVLNRIDVKKARWTRYGLELIEGVEREFAQGGTIIKEEQFKKRILKHFEETPDQIWHLTQVENKNLNLMNIKELWNYIQLLNHSGSRVDERLIDFHIRIAMPFVNLIMALIGISMALQNPRTNQSASFGIGILISFIYWEVIGISKSLGYADTLSPFLSAWLPNLIFGMVGICLIVRAKK